jgi:DNA-binding transcriptional MerR regulator
MRIAELSRRSGVPTTTIKFYIREGLVPAGERSHRNQARYGEAHLDRLDLIRALREVAGLTLETVRAVLEQTDKPWGEGDPVAAALEVVYRTPDREHTSEERAEHEEVQSEVGALVRSLPWVRSQPGMSEQHLNIEPIADAVMQLRRYLEPELPVERLRKIATAAWLLSEAVYEGFEDIVPQPGDDLITPTRSAVLGTLLVEPLVLGLLRTATAMRSVHITNGLPLPRPHLADLDAEPEPPGD